jgi:drug/metabolite transporter (DMT)-like permease
VTVRTSGCSARGPASVLVVIGPYSLLVNPTSRLAGGLGLAVVSAVSFGMSGPLARGLLVTGWTPGAATLVRVAVAALLVAPLGFVAIRGRWGLLRSNLPAMLTYGVLAIGGAQLGYFAAVERIPVGPALLVEYMAPVVVVLFLWLRRRERPAALTLAGAAVALVGLVLVLDLTGVGLDPLGIGFALFAMVGAATYFLLSADTPLPPTVLAGGGLLIGSFVLGLLGLLGVLPMAVSSSYAVYDGREVPVWIPVLGLGVVSAALAYTTGIAAAVRLGSRLASFMALTEVLAAIVLAWLVLGEVPRPVQVLGAAAVVAGVVLVKMGERTAPEADRQPEEAVPAAT